VRGITWLRADPRGKLVIAWAVLLLLTIVIFAVELGQGPADALRVLTLFYVLPVLVPINGVVLRQRRRSLWWLLLHLVGLGLVPVLVALLARPGHQA
jgi:uncharacterized membrane protein YhaH (DUF805 family)